MRAGDHHEAARLDLDAELAAAGGRHVRIAGLAGEQGGGGEPADASSVARAGPRTRSTSEAMRVSTSRTRPDPVGTGRRRSSPTTRSATRSSWDSTPSAAPSRRCSSGGARGDGKDGPGAVDDGEAGVERPLGGVHHRGQARPGLQRRGGDRVQRREVDRRLSGCSRHGHRVRGYLAPAGATLELALDAVPEPGDGQPARDPDADERREHVQRQERRSQPLPDAAVARPGRAQDEQDEGDERDERARPSNDIGDLFVGHRAV